MVSAVSKRYEDITVVAIYGDSRIRTAMPAVQKTLDALPGSKPLLISNVSIATEWEQKPCAPMSYEGYSEFTIYCLHQYIQTPYCLIVQHDGWAFSGENWNDDWLNYDYVGAPSHAALLPNGEYHVGYGWTDKAGAKVVQNGGFSLRSKTFLETPSVYGITRWKVPEPTLLNEDVQLCCFMRPSLEDAGVKFCPDDKARYFSFEHLGPPHEGMDLRKVFGHHSRFRQLLSNNDVLWKMTQEQMKQTPGEQEIYDLFTDYYGHTVHMA